MSKLTSVDGALQQNVGRVLRPDETDFHERETALHGFT